MENAVFCGVGAVAAVVLSMFFPVMLEPIVNTITAKDQIACGADPATHVWYQDSKRLVICSRPSGLVVVEVPR